MDSNSIYEDALSKIEHKAVDDEFEVHDPNCDTNLVYQIEKSNAAPKEFVSNDIGTEATLENTTIKSGCCKNSNSNCIIL